MKQESADKESQNDQLEDVLDDSMYKSQESKIFGKVFAVENMTKPERYLPQYQQNQLKQQPSCVQDCSGCCGECCINMTCIIGICPCSCASCCCMYELPTSKSGLVQKFGKFDRFLTPGLNMINPCTQQIREVDMKVNILSCGRTPTITKDNVKADIQSSISYRITNPISIYYGIGNRLNNALATLTASSLRQTIGELNLDQALSGRQQISQLTTRKIYEGAPKGIDVRTVFIEEIMIDPKVVHDLTSAARQKRLSEAQIITSKGQVQAAALMKESADLLDTKAAMQIRYLQMVQKMSQKGVLLLMDIGAHKKGHK